jgi:hypothetical protein
LRIEINLIGSWPENGLGGIVGLLVCRPKFQSGIKTFIGRDWRGPLPKSDNRPLVTHVKTIVCAHCGTSNRACAKDLSYNTIILNH